MNCVKTLVIGSVPVLVTFYLKQQQNMDRRCVLAGEEKTGDKMADVTTTTTLQHAAATKSMKLEQVQVIFRHGARTPIKTRERLESFSNLGEVIWCKDAYDQTLSNVDIEYTVESLDGTELPKSVPHQERLKGGCAAGQLTAVGQQDAFELGMKLAEEYIFKHGLLLRNIAEQNDIYIRSTNSQRTITTAACVLAGMYGKENLTEPIRIRSKPIAFDELLPNFNCGAKLKERFIKLWKEHKHEQDSINIELGIRENTKPLNFIDVLDVIRSREAHGLYIPKQLIDKKEMVARRATELQTAILGGDNHSQLKKGIGCFLDTLCCRLTEVKTGGQLPKFILYSCHDTTVMSVLLAFGLFDDQWPKFCANVIIELYTDTTTVDGGGRKYVRILYNHEVVSRSEAYGEYIPLEQFLKSVESLRVCSRDKTKTIYTST